MGPPVLRLAHTFTSLCYTLAEMSGSNSVPRDRVEVESWRGRWAHAKAGPAFRAPEPGSELHRWTKEALQLRPYPSADEKASVQERFREPDNAAAYVASGLMHDFPNATVEVIQYYRKRSRRIGCKTSEIGPVLSRMCKPFPMASVEYHPENKYGFVAEIRCHGERGGETTFRRHTKERPRVLVLLTEVDGEAILVGSHVAPKPE